MSTLKLDLTNCDRELIHIPGRIQSHGFLIVLDSHYLIRYFSANINSLFKVELKEIAGQPISWLDNFFDGSYQADTLKQSIILGRSQNNTDQTNPFFVSINGKPFYIIISLLADNIFLEFEQATLSLIDDTQRIIARSVTLMLANNSLNKLVENAALQVKNITGYDRVMIYKFAQDGHGEVVAEARNPNLPSWLGLHYPASDIPQQARELYKLNPTRLIADVNNATAEILTEDNNLIPLDLTFSQLRAVSPIHIQYLQNMGVASSYSISLLYHGELWGLIACHNYTARFIDFKLREASKLVGYLLSSALTFRQEEENNNAREFFSNNLDLIAKYLQLNTNITDALTGEKITILNIANAESAVLFYENQVIKLGNTPSDDELNELNNWLKKNNGDIIFQTDHLSKAYPPSLSFKNLASGIMHLVLSKELGESIIWFKREQLQNIKWAGNPEKKEVIIDGYKHISPRNSFREWSETVTAKSENWASEEINAALRLRDEILYAVNLKAGAIRLLNEKLRLAYEELNTFSYTISHDLKNPIAAIKGFAQLMLTDKTHNSGALTMLDLIVGRADQMTFMINAILNYTQMEKSMISIQKIIMNDLIKEVVNDYDLEKNIDRLEIIVEGTPDIHGDAVMIAQVFGNLLGNAIKYSTHQKKGLIHIKGEINEKYISYSISDDGIGIPDAQINGIFDLFNRTDNVKEIEGTGVGLAIVKRIVEKHKGQITVKSVLGKGSNFIISFPKQA